jgi:hypothetical protein
VIRYVLIKAFCNPVTVCFMGYTEKAVERKIEDGIWRLNKEYIRARDGHIMIDVEGVQRWVEDQKQAA